MIENKRTYRFAGLFGWKYLIYKKYNKWPFVFIAGFVDASGIFLVLLLSYLLFPISGNNISMEILYSVIICLLIAPFIGYISYRKLKSVYK